MRDNQWLLQTTKRLWRTYFQDTHPANNVVVLFSRRNRRVMGSIKYDPKTKNTYLRINGHFRNPTIPQYVVEATIAHEIVHYLHGFSSPQNQRYLYPHQNGVVKRELLERGLSNLEKKAKTWLKQQWTKFLAS